MELLNVRIIIASDVTTRDGIGVEFWYNDVMVAEIFRDDSKKSRTVSLYKEAIPLEMLEKWIQVFKQEIPWEFIDDIKEI